MEEYKENIIKNVIYEHTSLEEGEDYKMRVEERELLLKHESSEKLDDFMSLGFEMVESDSTGLTLTVSRWSTFESLYNQWVENNLMKHNHTREMDHREWD